MSTARAAIPAAPAAKHASGLSSSGMSKRACDCGAKSGDEEYCSSCGGRVLQRHAASCDVAGVEDPLEREADRAADTVMSGRGVARIGGAIGTSPRVQRSAIYNRVPVGSSGRVTTGKLVDWDYVVYQDHVRLGNRVFDKNTKQVIGSWPWLTNNPGDITVDPKEAGKPRSNLNRAYEWGAIKDRAASTGHIPLAIFPDGATGAAALKKLYAEPEYRDKTLKAAIEVHLGRPEARVPGVDDPQKYLDQVKERARKLGVKENLLNKTLAELDAAGAMDAIVEGFGAAEGYENVGITYTCDGRDKSDDPKIPQTVRNLGLFKNLPDKTPDEVLRLLGCKVPSGDTGTVQKKSTRLQASTAARAADAGATVSQALSSAGTSLPGDVRQFMETRFGHDFSKVRIHTGAAAESSAQEVAARAYTVGQHIVFAAGQYAPGTQAGQRLLAHELTHVVQQTRGGAAPLQRQPAAPDTAAMEKQLQEKLRARAKLQQALDESQQRFVDERDKERSEATLKEEVPRLKAQAQGDVQSVVPSRGLSILKKAIDVVRGAGEFTLTVRFELTYQSLSDEAGKARASTDIPRLEKAIGDAWTVDMSSGHYAGNRFRLLPKISYRPASAQRSGNALQITVRGQDNDPSTGTFWTGEISLAEAHLQGDRIIVVAHELYHLFGYFDTYFTMELPSKDSPGGKKVVQNVGRGDPSGRGDLLGMPDPKLLREGLSRGEIPQEEFDRQTKKQLRVWEEDADAILYALGAPPVGKDQATAPPPDPDSEDFEEQADAQLDAIRKEGERKLGEIRKRTQGVKDSMDWLGQAERAMQMDKDIAALRERIIEAKSGGVKAPAKP